MITNVFSVGKFLRHGGANINSRSLYMCVVTDDSVRDSSNMEGGSDSGSIKAIISDWRMLIDVVTVFTGFVAVSFNDATLAILLDRFGLNSASKGATFLISACCYSVASLIYGRIGKIIVCYFIPVKICAIIFCLYYMESLEHTMYTADIYD